MKKVEHIPHIMSDNINIQLPKKLQDAVGSDQVRSVYTPPKEVNTCCQNFLHCRDNQIFQLPFCLLYPVAAYAWAACLPFRWCANADQNFTKFNDGSILLLTDKRLIHYTPEVKYGPCLMHTNPEVIRQTTWYGITKQLLLPHIITSTS